jgi:hypothetical protein
MTRACCSGIHCDFLLGNGLNQCPAPYESRAICRVPPGRGMTLTSTPLINYSPNFWDAPGMNNTIESGDLYQYNLP